MATKNTPPKLAPEVAQKYKLSKAVTSPVWRHRAFPHGRIDLRKMTLAQADTLYNSQNPQAPMLILIKTKLAQEKAAQEKK